MNTAHRVTALLVTLATLALLGAAVYATFRVTTAAFLALEPHLTPAFKAALAAILLGAALIALALHSNAARRGADTLRLEKARLYGRLLDALASGSRRPALEHRLALLGGGGVIRAWREASAEASAGATPEQVTRLVREMRRDLGQGSAGFGGDALAGLLGTEPAEHRAPRTAEAT